MSAPEAHAKRRYLILGTGRSGSSLLSAILADAGANFGMPPQADWDRHSGAYEHPLLLAATAWQSRAEKIRHSLIPDALGRKYCTRRMAQTLDNLLQQAHYAKAPSLLSLVYTVVKLGYKPKIILSYRGFMGFARSYHLRNGLPLPELADKYVADQSTALMLLQKYGGCVVGWDELVDLQATAWADTVSACTGLDRAALLHQRQQRVTPRRAPDPEPLFPLETLDPRIPPLEQATEALTGAVIEPA